MTSEPDNPTKFSKRYRLIAASDFQKVFKTPMKVSTPDLLFLYSENNQAHPRLGLAIAKKQIPLAVDRNRVKRLIRESFRKQRQNLSSIDIVVLGRKSLINMDNTRVQQQLDSLWNQLIEKVKYNEANN
jgi:ribonuclease P protein component